MPTLPPDDELEGLGLLDPRAGDADHRRAAIALLLDRGATIEELGAEAHRLNSFVVEFLVRPRGPRVPLDEAARQAGVGAGRAGRARGARGLSLPRVSG